MIYSIDNFINEKELQRVSDICKLIDKEDYWYNAGQSSVYYASRVLKELNNKKDYLFLIGILKNIKNKTLELFNPDKDICADSYMFAKWMEGSKQYPHSDSHANTGLPNDTYWRKFSTVLYLNEDFNGGETYFPQHGITIEPKKGRLALFNSGLSYKHGVSEIKDGTRFNLIAFWGHEMNKCREYRI
jgi:hypothetical protein